MPAKSLSDMLDKYPEYAALSWRDKEARALFVASNRALLRKRLNDAKACLLPQYGSLFTGAKFDFAGKRLICANGKYALQWLTRERPDQPEDYDNQQTNIGTCVLIRYGNTWRAGAAIQVLDRASGEMSFGTVESVDGARLAVRLTDGARVSFSLSDAGTTIDGAYTLVPLD